MLALGGYSIALNVTMYLLIHLVIPLGLIVWLWKGTDKCKADWFIKSLAIGSSILLIFLAGFWQLPSYYFRYCPILLFPVTVLKSYRKVEGKPNFVDKGVFGWVLTGLGIGFLLLCTYFDLAALRGRFFEGESIELSFPFKNGIYMTDNGGSSSIINSHRINPIAQELDVVRAMQYAVDIHKLNVLGTIIRGFPWSIPENVEIFGEILYSPCDGKVIHIDDRFPDLSLEEAMQIYRTRKPTDPPPTNHITIERDGIYINMGHLMKGSVLVQEGDHVKAGQPIAQIGGSGAYPPHLHIHAAKGSGKWTMWRGEGVPIEFNGRFLVRNSLVFSEK